MTLVLLLHCLTYFKMLYTYWTVNQIPAVSTACR